MKSRSGDDLAAKGLLYQQEVILPVASRENQASSAVTGVVSFVLIDSPAVVFVIASHAWNYSPLLKLICGKESD